MGRFTIKEYGEWQQMARLKELKQVETDVKDSQDKIGILSTKVKPETPLNTTSQDLSGAVNEVKGDLDAHKEDYTNQRQQDQLKVATVEKELNDYKSTMTNANVNQEAKQKVSGRGIISLPKNSANGQVSVSVKGETIFNHADNGVDYAKWSVVGVGTTKGVNGIHLVEDDGGIEFAHLPITLRPSTLYTAILNIKDFNASILRVRGGLAGCVIDVTRDIAITSKGILKFTFTTMGVMNVGDTLSFSITNSITGQYIDFEVYGVLEGDWTTNNEVNKLFKSGTKSTVSASRLKGVGKNLFDKSKAKIGFGLNSSGNIINNPNLALSDFIPVLQYAGYRRAPGLSSTTQCFYYDSNKTILGDFITLGDLTGLPIPNNARYIRLTILTTALDTFQIEKSTVVTPYEPYTESTSYLPNVGELRSVGIVKDEIIKVDGVWKHIKRIDNDGVTILATPIITPIDVSGNLLSYPSGTVYVENVVADAGVYTTKFDIKELQLPIRSIDKLIKYNFTTGVQTVLDTSLAVINADKKSFTHPNLTKDDMVFLDYFYDVESTLGETTIEYYDSRHTIKDSVNNKFYKWDIKSANGVPTVNLTEVL